MEIPLADALSCVTSLPMVGILKKFMEKSVKDGKPWNYGLLKYRVTPISGNLPSPLEVLTGCRPRPCLPQIPSSVGKSVD